MHPDSRNDSLFAYLGIGENATSILPASSTADPYMGCGCHPDTVARVWDTLGKGLPPESKCVAGGRPALVNPASGVVIAIAIGTQYCLRLPAPLVASAMEAGAKTTTKWSGGTVLDVSQTFGDGWVFGAWLAQEPAWCAEAFKEFATP